MGFRMFLASKVSRIFLEVASAMVVLACQPYRPVVFMGESMSPTYKDREVAIASTDVGQVVPGDIVVIKRGEGSIIKRVAHVAGESIDYYRVGGEWQCGLDIAFHKEVLKARFPRRQLQIPHGYIFVLGDNWLESLDSRQFGLVPVSAITAKLPNARPRVPLPGDKMRFFGAAGLFASN